MDRPGSFMEGSSTLFNKDKIMGRKTSYEEGVGGDAV